MIKKEAQKYKKKAKHFFKKVLKYQDKHDFYIGLLSERKKSEEGIPKYDLEKKHIANLKVLVNREELLSLMPVNAVCAEIGVNEGDFSSRMLAQSSPAKLHLIDAWGNESRYHNGLKDLVTDKFKADIAAGKMEINVGYSTEVLSGFPENYFDWIYLDTDHSYDLTRKELDILQSKMKPGGIIAGHDYIIGNWTGDYRYGVIEAVHEFCVKENWELIYITINNSESPSFAIRKIVSL